MPIDINNLGIGSIRNQPSQEKTTSESRATPDNTAATRQDEVKLSQSAQRLTGAGSHAPKIDRAKVDRIRDEIAEGRYHVDPIKLAEKFIALESELSSVRG